MKEIKVEIDCSNKDCAVCKLRRGPTCDAFGVRLIRTVDSTFKRCPECIDAEIKECEFEFGEKVLVKNYYSGTLFIGNNNWHEAEFLFQAPNGLYGVIYEGKFKLWRKCKKYPPAKTVKKALTMMKWLIKNDYKPDQFGNWICMGKTSFLADMWQYCGKKPSPAHGWMDEWIK